MKEKRREYAKMKKNLTIISHIVTAPLHSLRFALHTAMAKEFVPNIQEEAAIMHVSSEQAIQVFVRTPESVEQVTRAEALVNIIMRCGIGIIEGAAIYGLAAAFALAYSNIGGVPALALQGLSTVFSGIILGSGRGVSGMVSATLVSMFAFSVYAFVVPALLPMLPFNELELHLIGGTATILATILFEGLAGISTEEWERQIYERQEDGKIVDTGYTHSEFYLHEAFVEKLIKPFDPDKSPSRFEVV